MVREIPRKVMSGGGVATVLLLLGLFAMLGLINAARADDPGRAIGFGLFIVVLTLLALGLFTVQPGQGRVLQLFGEYKGTVREDGLRWANPIYT